MIEKVPMVNTWRGKLVSDMTHEELIEAFNELADLYKQELESNNKRRRYLFDDEVK